MRIHSPPMLRLAFGAMSISTATALAAVDTSQWTCQTCPYEKTGVSGAVEVGVGGYAGDRARYGDATGLNGKTSFLSAGGSLRYRGEDGLYASASAADLGLDARSLRAEVGQEGLYRLRLGYAEIPHGTSDATTTPFVGAGTALQTLPAGYPAASTAQMPLATTLQPLSPGTKRSRFDLGTAWQSGNHWTHRVSVRHEVRDGREVTAGSFYVTAAQLISPVNQVTDQFEVSTSFASHDLQASLAYQASSFRNDDASLTWANPFLPVVPGATSGQLALAPDNRFQQLVATGAYALLPWLRVSGEMAGGRMTQDAAFLVATLTPALAGAAAPLPQASLHGRVDTFNASFSLTATPIDGLRLVASYLRNNHDNRTPTAAYPAVSTDIILGPVPRQTPAFSFKQDRVKLGADYRFSKGLTAAAGADWEQVQRSYQDVVNTDESKVWARVVWQALEPLGVALKVAHAERTHSTYGVATWVTSPQNPLLRLPYLADRRRDMVGMRADLAVSETLGLGAYVDTAQDDYTSSPVGLHNGHTTSGGLDASYALSEQTQLQAYAQGERMRLRQTGSEAYAQADWSGSTINEAYVLGLGVKHSALGGKLELTGDIVTARSRNNVAVEGNRPGPAYPINTQLRDSLRLRATYRLQDGLWLSGTYRHERQTAQDWQLDGIGPATLQNLLALGQTPPRYRVDMVGVTLRYGF